MPKIRRRGVPRALLQHLFDRVDERAISVEQLQLFAAWLELEPEVPEAQWFKRFPEMIVCGEGEFVKTFLRSGQVAVGQEVV
jgi:GNAT superfamily N-acetyltransferase